MPKNNLDNTLPEDIIFEILLQLPFQSVLTCKLVSKQWLNLIKLRNFSNLYRDKSMFVCFHRPEEDSLYSVFLPQCHDISTFRRFPLLPHTKRPLPINSLIESRQIYGNKLVSGSSNTTVCVKTHNSNFVYYSLLAGDSYTVTDAPRSQHSSSSWLCYGFGYDCYEDDHKIFLVCRQERSVVEQNKENSLFWVYSFKSHGWKSFDGFPYHAYNWGNLRDYDTIGLCFNGALHWVLGKKLPQNRRQFVIVTYDVHTCRFGEVSVPKGFDYDLDDHLEKGCGKLYRDLYELDGRLCFVHKDDWTRAYDCGEVWVMKEYGVEESWTKLFRIKFLYSLFELTYMRLYECRDGKRVALYARYQEPNLIWHDIEEENQWRDIDLDSFLNT